MKILQSLVNEMNQGKGTLGKFLKDDSLYDNLNEVVDNTNSLINEVKNTKVKLTNVPENTEKIILQAEKYLKKWFNFLSL